VLRWPAAVGSPACCVSRDQPGRRGRSGRCRCRDHRRRGPRIRRGSLVRVRWPRRCHRRGGVPIRAVSVRRCGPDHRSRDARLQHGASGAVVQAPLGGCGRGWPAWEIRCCLGASQSGWGRCGGELSSRSPGEPDGQHCPTSEREVAPATEIGPVASTSATSTTGPTPRRGSSTSRPCKVFRAPVEPLIVRGDHASSRGSPRAVGVAAVLHPVDQHDSVGVEDLVDDSVVAASG